MTDIYMSTAKKDYTAQSILQSARHNVKSSVFGIKLYDENILGI